MMERDLMSLQSVMKLEMGTDQTIRCRFVSKWFKIDSYVYTKEGLFSEIEKNKPDVVLMDLDLYEKMDGIETSRRIRNRFDVPVVYV
jgi:CheY-like chemotaxis protein